MSRPTFGDDMADDLFDYDIEIMRRADDDEIEFDGPEDDEDSCACPSCTAVRDMLRAEDES